MIDDLVADIAALGTAAGDRIYQRSAPQRALYPHVIVTGVGGPSGLDLGGADGHGFPRFQVDIYGLGIDSLAAIGPIARSIRQRLHGFRGLMGSTQVLCIVKDNEQDLDDIDGDKVLRRILQDYLVTYLET